MHVKRVVVFEFFAPYFGYQIVTRKDFPGGRKQFEQQQKFFLSEFDFFAVYGYGHSRVVGDKITRENFLFVSGTRPAEQGAYTPYLWPKAFTFDNYIRLFTDRRLFDFPRWLGNTLLVAGCSCALTTMLTLMVAYVYSRLRFPKRRFLMNASLVLGMFPGFMSIIAIYHFMKAIGLDQTLLALILVYSGGAALNYYIAKGYFDTIPKSLDEAAILDGASNSTVFWKIILPNSKPVIATTAINAFINPIVDYIFVSVIMKDNYNNFTVAKGLYTMVDKTNIYEYYTVFCAGAVIVAIPVVLLFLRVQKYYVAGVVGGSVKG